MIQEVGREQSSKNIGMEIRRSCAQSKRHVVHACNTDSFISVELHAWPRAAAMEISAALRICEGLLHFSIDK